MHGQLVAHRHLGEHDDFHPRVLEHRRVARHRFLLVLDVFKLDGDPAPVRLFGVAFDRDHVVKRLVVADVVLAVPLHGALLGDGFHVVDRQHEAAVRLDLEMLNVFVDHQRRIGAGVGAGIGIGIGRVGEAGRQAVQQRAQQ